MSKTAFAIAAHPDDIEFGMAGTLLLLKDAGFDLHYMNIATGSCGSVEMDAAATAKTRLDEAMNAAAHLGAAFHPPLVGDIEIFYEPELLRKIGAVVREVAPDVLLVPSPQDYMEDHTNACRLAVTAAFCRNMPNWQVTPPRPPIQKDVTVYHAQPFGNRDALGQVVTPQFFIDTTSVMAPKCDALAEHRSQKEWLDRSQGMNAYLDEMKDQGRETGRMSGAFEFAEGWRRHYYRGFCGPDADPLRTALGDDLIISSGVLQG